MQTGRFHIILDLEKVDNQILNDGEGLKNFLVDITEKIDMHVLHGPVVVSGIPENPGLSGFVIIDYSHISAHTFTKNGEAQVDIFSCKSFDQEKAKEAVLEYFKASPSSMRFQQVCWE
ncbi:S-adenosylmethionine decarboxylase [Candidatus Daviesbacteria bacterium]|nr:S-adenosylmethionine decarboxylase [Candidatus Daviesbacteria bacterium]